MLLTARILLVEDHAPFRLRLRSELQPHAEWEIVGEACDGRDAVRQAHTLQPNLVLLELGLPILSGMEALGRILEHLPTTTVVVVSQEASPDIVAETFRLGARGYVHKPRAHRDLLSAIAAVLSGQLFLSEELVVDSAL